jgi:hypothetical protein
MTRMVALGPEQARIAGKLRTQAAQAQKDHPTMQVHGHLRDAARQLERGNHDAAERHMRAAIQSLTPLQLVRHGHLTDDEQGAGKGHMALLTRHLLNIKDISDTADANRNLRAAMNAPPTNPIGRPDGTANGPGPVTAPAGKPMPARNWIKAGQQSAGPKLLSNVDLAFNIHQARDRHGRWTGTGAETSQFFGSGTHPGSFEHLAAIEDLGRRAASQTTDPASQSPTMQSALHNVAKSLAERDITGARAHMVSAHWANKHEANGMWDRELADLDKQIGMVPPQRTGWKNRRTNPLMHQHPGKMVPTEPMLALSNLTFRDWTGIFGIAIELSAETAGLAVTPAPRGRPGGPGLYGVKGMGHTPYLQQIVKALIEKRGMAPDKAYAIARAAIRRWMATSKHPEVKAAAGAAEAGELARQARAKL